MTVWKYIEGPGPHYESKDTTRDIFANFYFLNYVRAPREEYALRLRWPVLAPDFLALFPRLPVSSLSFPNSPGSMPRNSYESQHPTITFSLSTEMPTMFAFAMWHRTWQ